MHPIAEELNLALRGTIVDALLSDVGRRMFFPKGIVAQAAEAARAGVRHNATKGIATEEGSPCVLPSVARHYRHLSAAQIASYAPTGGVASLRRRWGEELRAKNPTLPKEYSLPIVTGGITHGISVVAELFVSADDAIVIPAPFWGNYSLIFKARRDARIVPVPLFTPDGRCNIEALPDTLRAAANAQREAAVGQQGATGVGQREATGQQGEAAVSQREATAKPRASSRTLLCILNFPHNPTGYTPTAQEAERIVGALTACAAEGTRLAVLCDDAYFGLQYEKGLMEESLFAPLSNAHENLLAIKLDGATKEELAWGLRVGFITFASKGLTTAHYRALEQKTVGMIRGTLSNCNVAAQHIIQSALESPTHQQEKRRVREVMAERYRAVRAALGAYEGHPHIRPLPFNSGYFVTLRCRHIDTERLRLTLLERDIGIIAIDKEHIRITYSTIDLPHIKPVFAQIFEVADAIL